MYGTVLSWYQHAELVDSREQHLVQESYFKKGMRKKSKGVKKVVKSDRGRKISSAITRIVVILSGA